MKTTTARTRLAWFAGLLLLSLLLLVTAAQVAQAAEVSGSGAGGAGALVATSPPAGTEGRGGVAFAPSAVQPVPAAGVQPTAATTTGVLGMSTTTAWIVFGSIAAAVLVGLGVWALARRRRLEPGSAAYCARHPADSMCAV
jgi:hypothetical protein